MPVRDAGEHLHTAVASILEQSFADYELLIIDDHSRDDAISRLGSDPRIRISANQARGIVAALNTGLRLARGELIARMDADDISEPARLEAQLRCLDQRGDVGLCGTGVEIFRSGGALRDGFRRYQAWLNGLRSPSEIDREIFVENPIPHPSLMARRALLQRLGGYRQAPWSEDYDLVLRSFALGVRMAKPAGVHLRWREHERRITHRDPRCSPAAFTRCKAYFLARTLLRERGALLWGAGPTGARFCDALQEEGVAIEGFVDIDPRKIGRRKRGLPVFGPDSLTNAAGPMVVGTVGSAGARERIRAWLVSAGRREGADFIFAA